MYESVVLPELSGPYISTTLPLGIPPIPKAKSIDKAPVDIAGPFLHYQFQVSSRNLLRTAFLFGQKLYLVFLPCLYPFLSPIYRLINFN